MKKIYKTTLKKLSKWWYGEVYENPPNSKVFFLGIVYKPSAIFARSVVKFLREEFKFVITTAIAILTLILHNLI